MLAAKMRGVRITGVSVAVPSTKKKTDDYVQYFGEKEIQRFKEATGIEARHISGPKQTASDLCYVAAKKLLEEKNRESQIDALLFCTQTPDYRSPATAFVLHKRLGLNKDCICFDINLGCSAFVTGLYTMAGMVNGGLINSGLLLIGDAFQEHPVSDDHSQTMMFGDAGTAVLVEKGNGCITGMIRSDGEGYKNIIAPFHGFRKPVINNGKVVDFIEEVMDGNEVFLFTITQVPKLFKEFFNFFNVTIDSYDSVILHQANKMVIDKIAKKLKVSKEKVPLSLDKYGNTNGVSIPVTICDAYGNDETKRNVKFITSGFGVGMQQGVVAFDVNTENIYPIIYSDDYYEEGFVI
jgi:3-oxoacyl-[acyl-carrier-protein] synthase-3